MSCSSADSNAIARNLFELLYIKEAFGKPKKIPVKMPYSKQKNGPSIIPRTYLHINLLTPSVLCFKGHFRWYSFSSMPAILSRVWVRAPRTGLQRAIMRIFSFSRAIEAIVVSVFCPDCLFTRNILLWIASNIFSSKSLSLLHRIIFARDINWNMYWCIYI